MRKAVSKISKGGACAVLLLASTLALAAPQHVRQHSGLNYSCPVMVYYDTDQSRWIIGGLEAEVFKVEAGTPPSIRVEATLFEGAHAQLNAQGDAMRVTCNYRIRYYDKPDFRIKAVTQNSADRFTLSTEDWRSAGGQSTCVSTTLPWACVFSKK